MTQESSKSSGKFRRFLSGFKKNAERKARVQPPLAPLPASEIPTTADTALVQQGPSAPATSTAITLVGPIAPDAPELEEAVNSGGAEEELVLPANIALAKDVLNKAGKKLADKIPQDARREMKFEIKASADINTLADNIGSVLVTMMADRQVEKSKQTHVQGLVTEWAKKTIPFVETGLTVANVLSCMSWNYMLIGRT
jgi:hypothetical protein